VSPLNLRQLEAFVAVIETGSFSGAARRLGLGQSTVSTHVAALERALALTLFDRAGRRIRPSRAGAALLQHAREILSARRRAEASMLAFREGDAGELLVAASTIPATYLMPRWLGAFRATRPGIRVTLKVGDSRDVARMLLEGIADLAVAGARPHPPGRFSVAAVAEDRLVLAVPPHHPLAAQRRCRPEDLKGVPFLQREAGSGTREAVDAALMRAGLDPRKDLASICELGSTEAVREGVKAGLGVAILSGWAVAEAAKAGTIRTLPLERFQDRRTIYLLSSAGRTLPPLAKAFAAWVRQSGKDD
jgi:DNA-binding transcriptional LysR family regulator